MSTRDSGYGEPWDPAMAQPEQNDVRFGPSAFMPGVCTKRPGRSSSNLQTLTNSPKLADLTNIPSNPTHHIDNTAALLSLA